MPSGCYNTLESLDYGTRKVTGGSSEVFLGGLLSVC